MTRGRSGGCDGGGAAAQYTAAPSYRAAPRPRLRLLRQVGDEPSPHLPSAAAAAAARPRSGLSDQDTRVSRSDTPISSAPPWAPPDSSQAPRRGRGLLRPLDGGEAPYIPAPPPRSPPQPPPLRGTADSPTLFQLGAPLQQRSCERVHEQRRQRRRAARELDAQRLSKEQERDERVQKAATEVEAHRRELARQAAEKDGQAHKLEEFQSTRRERMQRYMTQQKICEWQRREDADVVRSAAPSRQLRRRCSRARTPSVESYRRGRRRPPRASGGCGRAGGTSPPTPPPLQPETTAAVDVVATTAGTAPTPPLQASTLEEAARCSSPVGAVVECADAASLEAGPAFGEYCGRLVANAERRAAARRSATS